MKCIKCNGEIDLLKNHVASMQDDKVIGYIHIKCFNKQFYEEKDDEEVES